MYYRRWFSSHHLWSLYAAISSAEEQWPCKGKADVQFPLVLSAVTCAIVVSVFLSLSLPNIYILYTHRCICVCADVKFPWVLVCDPVACCHQCLCLYSISVSALKYGFPLCMALPSDVPGCRSVPMLCQCHCPYICALCAYILIFICILGNYFKKWKMRKIDFFVITSSKLVINWFCKKHLWIYEFSQFVAKNIAI